MNFEKFKGFFSTPLAILVGAALITGAILYNGGRSASIADTQNNPQVSDAPVRVEDPSTLFGDGDASIGSTNAKVTIVEFSDFQCPFCRKFVIDTYGQLKKEYIDTGKVRLVFRHYPLTQLHSGARPAAMAALCANDQGKFWEYHDAVFAQQQKQESSPMVVTRTISFGIPELKKWAAGIGLNAQQFNACLDSEKYGNQVDADTDAGTKFGVSGTPSFFINGLLIVGAQPYSTIKAAIDAELAK